MLHGETTCPNNEPLRPCPQDVRLALLETRMEEFRRDFDRLVAMLEGGARPGALERLESRIEGLDKKLTRMITVVAVLAAGSGAGATKLLQIVLDGGAVM